MRTKYGDNTTGVRTTIYPIGYVLYTVCRARKYKYIQTDTVFPFFFFVGRSAFSASDFSLSDNRRI